jgi:uncharacterized protein (TIGR02284 family)
MEGEFSTSNPRSKAMSKENPNLNLDPLTGAPGAHPVGTGVGAVGGAAAGAAVGMVGGPVGAAVGGVLGAVAGGLAGKGAAEGLNPTAEEAYWRDAYKSEPYYREGFAYDEYAPAYRLGYNGRARYSGEWVDVEPHFASDWSTANSGSSLAWPEARYATHAAWTRVSAMDVVTSDDAVDNDDVLDTLEDLSECCKDGEYGFRKAAEQVKRADLRTVLTQCANDCLDAAQELHEHIHALGGTPDDSGSTTGAVHRGWIAVKTMFSTYDDKAVLNECERGEDHALARYRKALKQPMSVALKQLVERQMQGVQRNHDQIKQLRDEVANR